jgi:hypothetical protein
MKRKGYPTIEVGDVIKKRRDSIDSREGWVTVVKKTRIWGPSDDVPFHRYHVMHPDGSMATYTDEVLSKGPSIYK